MKKILYIPKNYAERYYILTCPECGCEYIESRGGMEFVSEYDEFDNMPYTATYSVCPNCGGRMRVYLRDKKAYTETELVKEGYVTREELDGKSRDGEFEAGC